MNPDPLTQDNGYTQWYQLAQACRQWDFSMPATFFGRLAQSVVEHSSAVTGYCHASVVQHRVKISYYATTTVHCQCQRCLQPVEQALIIDQSLYLLAQLPNKLDEPSSDYMVCDPTVSIRDLVEDELILQLPLIATHDYACAELPNKPLLTYDSPNRPFQGLADLLHPSRS